MFFARIFSGGSEWPIWRKAVWLALFSVTAGYTFALYSAYYEGLGLVALLVAVFISVIAAGISAYSSGAYYVKWAQRRKDKPSTEHPFVSVVFFLCALTVVIYLLGLGLDRQGVVNIPFYHQGSAEERKNPLICVNETMSLGLSAPYPEVLNTPATEIRSIGVCPYPLNGHSLKIQGLRVNGNEYLGRDLDWVGFDPPMHLKPGEEIEVVVIGRDPYFNLPDSPTYVIKRYLPYSQEEIKSLLMRGADEPGYKGLDWERMEKKGLFYLDHSTNPDKRVVDAIYATYDGNIELDAWAARFPVTADYEIVKIPFSFCVKPESDFVLAGSMKNIPLWKRGIIITIEQDGTVLVRNPEDRTILFVCGNSMR